MRIILTIFLAIGLVNCSLDDLAQSAKPSTPVTVGNPPSRGKPVTTNTVNKEVTKPVTPNPVDDKATAKPVETKPVKTNPVDDKATTKPVETKPVKTNPVNVNIEAKRACEVEVYNQRDLTVATKRAQALEAIDILNKEFDKVMKDFKIKNQQKTDLLLRQIDDEAYAAGAAGGTRHAQARELAYKEAAQREQEYKAQLRPVLEAELYNVEQWFQREVELANKESDRYLKGCESYK